MMDFDKPLGVKRTVNARDRRLLTEVVQSIGRIGIGRSAEISGLPESTLKSYKAGKFPKFLQVMTRAGLRKLLRFEEDPTPAKSDSKPMTGDDALLILLLRLVDAVELAAVALTIIADKVGSQNDGEG